MPQLEYFVVCRDVLANMQTDEITLSHVLEDVFPEAYPHLIAKATAVSVWNINADDAKLDYQATLVVKVPGNADVQFPMNLAKRRSRYRAMQSILDIPIDKPGDIIFEVLLNGVHQASHTVRMHPVDDGTMKSGVSAPPPKA